MPSHDESSSAQRVGRLLDAARSSAPADASAETSGDPQPEAYWPSTWPPGRDDGPAEAVPGGESGRLSGVLGSGPRFEVSGRAAAAIGFLAVLIIGVLLALQLRGPSSGTVLPARDQASFADGGTGLPLAAPTSAAFGAVGQTTGAAGPTGRSPFPSPGGLRVYVVGQVRHPGVVSLSVDARVEDAVDAAGGATARADLTAMNLARKVVDGERIVVPRPGEKVVPDGAGPAAVGAAPGGSAPGGAAQGGGAAAGGPVDLNTATVADLDALPGVGPVIAGRIVAWRQQNGSFKTVDDLGEVSGIGDATLARLRPLVRV